jgi:transcriptional regulator with XRE-family HTH domain
MQRFGEKLRFLRKQHQMTLQEVATALNITSDGFISNLEAGRKKPSLEVVIKLARLFQVSLDNLLLDELELNEK